MDVVADFKNELDVECPGNNKSSPIAVVQFFLKSGSGTVKSIFLERALSLTANRKPNSGE